MTSHPATRALKAPRICIRTGCLLPVKKATAKYCSVKCCNLDPVRRERMREQARAASCRSPLSMVHQMSWTFDVTNPEEVLVAMAQGREDVPGGMSRLAG